MPDKRAKLIYDPNSENPDKKPCKEIYEEQIKQILEIFEPDCYIQKMPKEGQSSGREIWFISRPGWWYCQYTIIRIFWFYGPSWLGWKVDATLSSKIEDLEADQEYLEEVKKKLDFLTFAVKYDYSFRNLDPQ